MKDKIYNFFEHPKGFWAHFVQIIIFSLILISVGIVVLELFNRTIFTQYKQQFELLNHIVLFVFTVEYILRLYAARKRKTFLVKPLNIVDFLAIFPNYIELVLPIFINTTELRVLRVIRLLRLSRMLRLLRVFKYTNLVKRIFTFQGTILEAILPILVVFLSIKSVIWLLESRHLWISNADLGNLFAIIGFALGIILSQKIGVSYDKFIQVEEAIIRLYGSLRSLAVILDGIKSHFGSKITKQWAKTFLATLEDAKADNFSIHKANAFLYIAVAKVEKQPADLAMLYGEIAKDAAFCLSKKVRVTPKAYDTLLHQSTMLYLALITVFIPGITGIISVIVATYILYGMYRLTQDLDSIVGGEFNLINIDISELRYIVEN